MKPRQQTSTHFNYYTGLIETSETHFYGRAAAGPSFYSEFRSLDLVRGSVISVATCTHNMKARAAASPSSEGLSCVQFVARDVIDSSAAGICCRPCPGTSAWPPLPPRGWYAPAPVWTRGRCCFNRSGRRGARERAGAAAHRPTRARRGWGRVLVRVFVRCHGARSRVRRTFSFTH